MRIFFAAARPLLWDLLASLVFAAVAATTGDPRVAAAVALFAGLAQLAWVRGRGRTVGALQWVSLGLVVVFGAATFVTRDPRFMMFKPTLVYLVVAGTMLERGWLRRYMPAAVAHFVPDGLVVGWGYVWAGLMALTAALNAVVALTAGFAAWTAFIGVFPLASKAALFAVQYVHLRRAARRRVLEAAEPQPA
jgi:intracellular septation protein A